MTRFDRTAESGKNGGGGIMIYTKHGRQVVTLPDTHVCTPNIERVRTKLLLKKARPTFICSVYRPPDGNLDAALNSINASMENLNLNHRQDILIMGDFNIDYQVNNLNKTKLQRFEKLQNLDQLITQPTRISNTSATVIDHIYTNNYD